MLSSGHRWSLRALAAAALLALLTICAPPATAADSGRISGTVTVDGVATSGLTVLASSLSPVFSASAVTDANGQYELTGLPDAGYTLSIEDPDGLYQPMLPRIRLLGGPFSREATEHFSVLTKDPANGEISGIVTVDGTPTAGLEILLSRAAITLGQSTTGADGSYRFTGLEARTYTVTVLDLSDAYEGHNNYPVEVTRSAPAITLDIALTQHRIGTGAVSGTITDSANGAPLAGATVGVSGQGVTSQPVITGADGRFTFTALPAQVSLTVTATGYLPQSRPVTLPQDGSATADFALVAAAAIGGTVRSESGQQVISATVEAIRTDGIRVSAMTGADGYYEIGSLIAGTYQVVFGGPGTGWDEVRAQVTVAAGQRATVDIVAVSPSTGSISGSVLNGAGAAVDSICVTAYNEAGSPVGTAETVDGQWSIEHLDPGAYALRFTDCDPERNPAYAAAWWGGLVAPTTATRVTVVAGADAGLGVMTVMSGGAITGHLDLQASDRTVELPAHRDAEVTLFALVGDTWQSVDATFVDEAGDYEFGGLLPGDYRVAFADVFIGQLAFDTEYFDDVTTIERAVDVTVRSGVATAGIDATVAIPRPDTVPTPVALADLAAEQEGDIDVDDRSVRAGDLIEVKVGAEFAGEWVSVWSHSAPTLIGEWTQVSSTGSVSVRIPGIVTTGPHTLVAQNAHGEVLGWVRGIAITGETVSMPTPAALASTGATTSWLIPAAMLSVLAGLSLVLRRRARA